MATELDICIPYRWREDLGPVMHRVLVEWQKQARDLAVDVNICMPSASLASPWRPGKARNEAASLGASRFILFTDADMHPGPGALAQILADALVLDDGRMVIYTHWLNPGNPRTEQQWLDGSADWQWLVDRSKPFCSGSLPYGPMLLSRALFEKSGGWGEEFEWWGCEDDDFVRSVKKTGAGLTLATRPTFVHRIHTRTAELAPKEAYRKNVDRLRARDRR